jgi:ligand-binding sensor domain-containing protein/signal transduction histidine kinase
MGRLSILIALSAFPILLKSELLPIRTYTSADGLAADHIDCIEPDSRGFLWFCTPEGLSRFDGYHFASYGVKEGLAHRTVWTVVETRASEYLVGTRGGLSGINNGGLGAPFATYVPEREAVHNTQGINEESALAHYNSVTAILASRSGKIWCAAGHSLLEWNRANGFRRMPLSLPPDTRTNAIVEDAQHDLWIGANVGIYRVHESGVVQSFHVKDGLPGDWVEALLVDDKGRLWAATRGGLALISRLATGGWGVERVYTDKDGLIGKDVKALAEASDGTLWAGTSVGISRLRLGGGEPVVVQNLTRAQGLSDRQITALAEDKAGNMWAGTEGAGVMRIDRRGFTTYREQDGLQSDRLYSVLEDRAGELLAVTFGPRAQQRSLDVFDGLRFHNVAPTVLRKPAGSGWGWNQIVLQSRSGEWWMASKEGLCRYPAMKASDLDGRSPKVCYAREDNVFRVFEDSKGRIWATAQSKRGDQLMRWDPRTDAFSEFPARTPGVPDNDMVCAFAEDRQGNIWMGLLKGGLYRYDGRGFQLFQEQDGVPSGSICALQAGESGLWVGSDGGGLGRIVSTAEERPRVEVYNSASGMASDIVNCLVEDRQGRIYAGTSKGVDRLDPKTGYIRHFASGLGRGECTSAVRDRSGSLWFATKQGLSRLIPAEDRPLVNPLVFITDLRIGGAPYPVSHVGEKRVSRLELKPSQNQLQIEFVGLDYEPGDVLHYSYKLEGADSGWSPPHSQLTVNYAALRSGKYRFLVKAVTSEGVESAPPAEIDFMVLPPAWRRWWFESLAAAMAGALIFAAHRYRVTQVVNLERMRTAIATDLHDDIGASLSQIAILSEVARVRSNGQAGPDDPLERVAALARELVDSMGDIIWSIRSEPHGMDSLVRRMRQFALDVLGSQGIDFDLRTPPPGEEVQLSLQARRQLFLMFKECIHNAARHSHCSAAAAELNVVDREVVLTVADNGSGLNGLETAPRAVGGMGMASMRARAESLGGRLEVSSKPGAGCTVTIRFPRRQGVLAKPLL